jgi:hypothetical protein
MMILIHILAKCQVDISIIMVKYSYGIMSCAMLDVLQISSYFLHWSNCFNFSFSDKRKTVKKREENAKSFNEGQTLCQTPKRRMAFELFVGCHPFPFS